MSEWISVNDRLPSPPEYAEVLVTDGWRCWSAYCGIFGDWWTAYKNSDNPITHWQPMPELPKPEGPFYALQHPGGSWALHMYGDDEYVTLGRIYTDGASFVPDWLNQRWRRDK